jgi:hypothetical protein
MTKVLRYGVEFHGTAVTPSPADGCEPVAVIVAVVAADREP